jgi:periplasmic protein TonB
MSITVRWVAFRLMPVLASLLLHVAAYGAMLMAPAFTYPRAPILLVDLAEPDPAPPAPQKAPEPPKPKPKPEHRPLTLPKPVEPPLPQMPEKPVETPRVETPPPPPVTPPPVATPSFPAAAASAAPTGRGPLAPSDAPLSAGADSLPTQAGPPAPARPAPSVAALPPDAITQTAIPRGGYQVKPSYPSSARRAGVQGTTLLSVFVAADGHVSDVVVKESAGHPDLDRAAADAVRRWRFEPARRGAEAVSMWVLLPVEFRLR